METLSRIKACLGILAILSVIVVAGCDKIELGVPFDCKVDTNYILAPNLTFRIDSLNDYRCPRDVVCIWGGDVDLYFNIRSDLNNLDTLLKLSESPFIIGDYSWSIREVNPLRNHYQQIDQNDYRVKVIIQKNQI